ncbi:MAG: aminopeptidase [candidate division WOR-3 bacterium]|nr:MAG: aminopeptidase [candidate division WOR-3 bacterium]
MKDLERGLLRASNIVIRKCLAVKPGEKVVVVTDEPCRAVGVSIWTALRKRNDAMLIEMIPRKIHGEEPPSIVADAIIKSDVFIIPTSHSLTHTQARINANRNGARGATLPGITVEMMLRTLNADYKRIERLTKRVGRIMDNAVRARVESDNGTRLELELNKRKCCLDTGIVTKKGGFSNLPAGEAYIAPIEDRSKGSIVVDGSFAPIGAVAEPVYIEVKKGKITGLKGNRLMSTIFGKYGKSEKTLCEFGIGTNYRAKITGNVLEDEKVLGTIHVAFGNNLAFGGKNKAGIHLDAVIRRPSVWLDEKLIIRKGKFLI